MLPGNTSSNFFLIFLVAESQFKGLQFSDIILEKWVDQNLELYPATTCPIEVVSLQLDIITV